MYASTLPRARPTPFLLGVVFWLLSSLALFSSARAEEPVAAPESVSEKAASLLERIAIHGHFSQAYAVSDGHQVIGIPEKGTTDYRTAALQLHVRLSHRDIFAVQINHESLGKSRAQTVHDDLELDWMFYERRFGDSAIKVGRLPIPFGIYNEIRDVGTLLPFYRPARPLYEETSFATETIDGILFNHGFELAEGWHLDTDVHYGFWETYDAALRRIEAENSAGLELWLSTPVEGLRFSAGGLRYDTSTAMPFGTVRAHRQLSHFSVDGEFEHVKLQVEVKRDTAQPTAGGPGVSVWGGYAYLGIPLTDKLTANFQYEFLDVKLPATEKASSRDKALGLSYRFRPTLVVKAECHWESGFRADDNRLLVAGRPVVNSKTQFAILSLAVSF